MLDCFFIVLETKGMNMTPTALFGLNGKTALVTGGATGIGRMATTAIVAAGADVFIASRKIEACRATADEINRLGFAGRVYAMQGDVATEDGIERLIRDLDAKTDKLHILMNNAGRTWGAPLGAFPHSAWAKVYDLNVAGMFHLTQLLISKLAGSSTPDDPARVVHVGSVMGEIPMGDGAYSYATSKAAVHQMTRILAKELADQHITVNALAPGPFQSGMTKFAIGEDSGVYRVGERVPLGRVGRPEDIAACMQFLCGAGGSYITGAIIPVSGGINVMTGPSIFGEDE
jgi:NAD(P)-dependent dehydrogenase (short-subunit alcohol dehydrogenase family)